MLQRFVFIKVCMGENAFEFIAKYNDILTIKSTYLNVLSLCLLLSRFSGRSLCHFGFPLLRVETQNGITRLKRLGSA